MAVSIRECLIELYGIIRHSVNTKIMVRFPKKVLLVKAVMLQQEYLSLCIQRKIPIQPVQITGKWLNTVLRVNRISDRLPNRKFKVPRWVLGERLEIFWLIVFKLRLLIKLVFGYDPDAKNVDQSPFHGNEAGSKEISTLALKGAPTVPLIENHAATRERMSLNSITDSSEARVRQQVPGFEIMFRADGKQVEAKLAAYVYSKGLPFRVTVVTGPSGSYKESDILNFLENTHIRVGAWQKMGALFSRRLRPWAD